MGAVLARIAGLQASLAEAHRELAEVLQNELAVPAERALMSEVKPERLLTVRDVAERLSLSEKTVRRLRRRGEIPRGIEVGGVIRWRAEEIDAWVVSR